jgi:hypothetical protein
MSEISESTSRSNSKYKKSKSRNSSTTKSKEKSVPSVWEIATSKINLRKTLYKISSNSPVKCRALSPKRPLNKKKSKKAKFLSVQPPI